MAPRDVRRHAAAVFLLALAVRSFFLWRLRGSPFFEVPIVDAKEYVDWAEVLSRGGGLLSAWPDHSPLYAFFIAGIRAVWRDSLWPVYAVQALLGAAAAACCHLAAWRAARSLLAAAAAGLLAALAWPFVHPTGSALPQALELALVCGALLLLSGEEEPGWGSGLAAGCALGAAASMRPQFLPAALSLAAVWGLPRSERARAARAGFLFSLFALAFAWSAYLASRGVPALLQTRSGMNVYLGLREGASGKAADFPGLGYFALKEEARRAAPGSEDAYFFRAALARVRNAPKASAALFIRKLGLTMARSEIPAGEAQPWRTEDSLRAWRRLDFSLLFALGLPGLLLGAWGGGRFPRALLLFFSVGSLAVAAAAVAGRYRAPLLPALAVGAGWSVLSLRRWSSERRFLSAAALLSAALALLGSSIAFDAWAAPTPRRDLGIALALQARAGGGEGARAHALLTDWLGEHPGDHDAAWHLGLLQAHRKDWSGAAGSFARLAREKGGGLPRLHAYRAWTSALTGDLRGARAAAAEGARADPASIEACLRAALYDGLAGKPSSAGLCRCPLSPRGRARGVPEAEAFAEALRGPGALVDPRKALVFIEERAWAPDEYPAEELRSILGGRPSKPVFLRCP